MQKVAIGCIFYNNYNELKRLLDSIPPKAIDWFIAIDGIFKYTKEQNPNLADLSTDGSRKLIASHGINKREGKFLTCLVDKPNCTEFEKRNAYLETCEKLGGGGNDIDVLIIVDSDEYFVYPPGLKPIGCWNRTIKNIEIDMIQNSQHNVYGIRYLDEAGTDTYKPRIWVNPSKMRYINNSHYSYANIQRELQDIEYFNKFGSTYCQHAAKIIRGGVTLTHDHSLRDPEYLKRRKEYQKYLVAYEPLVQSGKTHEEADRIAKDQPAKDWEPT